MINLSVFGRGPVFLALVVFLALICLTALEATASDRLQDRMDTLAVSKTPVEIKADMVEYDRKAGRYSLKGNVSISQGDSNLTAESANLDEKTGEAVATGKARLVSKDNVLYAERISVNFNTKLGEIEEGNIFVAKENFHITGKSFKRVSEDEYDAVSGGVTTCDGDSPPWKFTARELKVRMDKDVTAKGVVFRVVDIPVLYSPIAWFPLLKPRTSGLLFPSIGYSAKEGMRFFGSYYWAPVDNFDATLNLDYRGRRGLGVGGNLRLALDKDTQTSFAGYYLDDRLVKRERYNIAFKHREVLLDDVSVKADINLSDRQYYRDLTDTAKDRTLRSIDSNIFITKPYDWGRAYMFNQYTLSLDVNNKVTVQRLPDVGVNVLKKQLFGFPAYLDMDASAAYFYKERGVEGGRYDLFPELSVPFDIGGVNITPRVGYRETVYDLGGKGHGLFDEERGLFGAGVTAQTGFHRLYTYQTGALEGVKHTIEPVVAYNYVTNRGGDLFPKFDGVDTFGRRSLLAYSLVNRFVIKYRDGDHDPRVDYLTLRLSQYYDIYVDKTVVGQERPLSNLYGEVTYKVGHWFAITNNFRYNVYSGGFRSVNTDVRLEDRAGRWHAVVGQRFSKDAEQPYMSPSRFDFFTPSIDFQSEFLQGGEEESDKLNFLTAEAGLKLGVRWDLTGKIWYDVHTDKFRETDLTIGYSSQCWGVTGIYINRPGERLVMFTLNLKGLGNVKI